MEVVVSNIKLYSKPVRVCMFGKVSTWILVIIHKYWIFNLYQDYDSINP